MLLLHGVLLNQGCLLWFDDAGACLLAVCAVRKMLVEVVDFGKVLGGIHFLGAGALVFLS